MKRNRFRRNTNIDMSEISKGAWAIKMAVILNDIRLEIVMATLSVMQFLFLYFYNIQEIQVKQNAAELQTIWTIFNISVNSLFLFEDIARMVVLGNCFF